MQETAKGGVWLREIELYNPNGAFDVEKSGASDMGKSKTKSSQSPGDDLNTLPVNCDRQDLCPSF